MYYEKNKEKDLDEKLFKNPTSEYRGTPFWSWNDNLDKNELLWQIEQLKKMGFGGFHMHTRSGMATPYLSEEFMDLIKACVDKAKDEKMLAHLYDEDRWPSGAAGGIVTKNPKYRQKALIFICENLKETKDPNFRTSVRMELASDAFDVADESVAYKCGNCKFSDRKEKILECEKEGKPYLLACYDIILNEDGTLKSGEIIPPTAKAKGKKWYAYVVTFKPCGWYNNQTYVDTLSNEAMAEFIKVTYEAYKDKVGDEFGKTVPSIFTDEPQFSYGEPIAFAESEEQLRVAWTTDFPETFEKAYGFDLIPRLAEVFWDKKDEPATVRYYFRDHVCERFTNAMADQCGKWCERNGISLTGHMLYEENLHSQTRAVGEAMRAYRNFGLPGIDLLVDGIELTTAKQTQSAVHQYGREGMLSELYGVTGWKFDFRGHKFQGDWQAALGVSIRVPHLSWVSMKGSAKRDYPASISYQSSWYKEYPYIEDHFARVNTALTRGTPAVNVAVIHPIESYWLMFGPSNATAERRKQLQDNFQNVTEWLLRGSIDFDFISESLLPDLYEQSDDKKLHVGKMKYGAIVVPGVDTIRSSTVKILTEFVQNGGKVIFLGEKPKYVNAVKSAEADALFNMSEHVEFTSKSLLDALEEERELEIYMSDGNPCRDYIYNKRRDNNCEWLFIARVSRPPKGGPREDSVDNREDIKLYLKGKVTPILYDTISGEIKQIPYSYQNGKTVVDFELYPYDSVLLRIENTQNACTVARKTVKSYDKAINFKDKVEFFLSEDNVLVLDMPKWSEDGKNYNEREEMLRIDKALRGKYSYPLADGADCQPWVIGEVKAEKAVYLKFEFESEIKAACKLAYEEAEEIIFNGKRVAITKDGYFVDKRIYTMKMPDIKKGKNELVIKAPLGKRTSLENYFLLGAFGVIADGTEARVVKLADKISFGTITDKGLPFYGGAITYQIPFETQKADIRIISEKYTGALISAKLDGKDVGKIVFSPYALELEGIGAGKHVLELTLYCSRQNCFGALHACGDIGWQGPGYWYKKGKEWAYEYQLLGNGILKSPEIYIKEN